MGLNKPVYFYTEKLLKEKGFDWFPSRHFVVNTSPDGKGEKYIINRDLDKDDLYLEYIERHITTIGEVCMWLYDKHKIWIVVNIDIQHKWYFELFNLKDKRNTQINIPINKYYNSATDAYEGAIEYCLTKLI